MEMIMRLFLCDMSAIPCQIHAVAPCTLYAWMFWLPRTQKFAFPFEAVANAATQPTDSDRLSSAQLNTLYWDNNHQHLPKISKLTVGHAHSVCLIELISPLGLRLLATQPSRACCKKMKKLPSTCAWENKNIWIHKRATTRIYIKQK